MNHISLIAVEISEICILSVQFYAGSMFGVINTIAPLEGRCFSEIIESLSIRTRS